MEPLYLDYAATTPVREEVRASMSPYLTRVFGNPSSAHSWGRAAAAALENARATAAECLGAQTGEIRFTRGGTESDNLAVLGAAASIRAHGGKPTVVVTAVEHKAVLDAASEATARDAGRLVVLPVSPSGAVDMSVLARALDGGPGVVSAMWVNNETGMTLPVGEIADLAAERDAVMHTDAVQAVGKFEVRVDEVPVTLLTVTGHKIYGPKGTGLLFVRSGTDLKPLLFGGGQERALRPGTEDVAGAVGLAMAMQLAVGEREIESARLSSLRDDLEGGLTAAVPGLRINAANSTRAPHVASVAVPDVDGAALLMALDMEGLAVSGGSACNSGASAGSHVITALYGEDDPHATIRFSLGRGTGAEDIQRAVATTVAVVDRLRETVAQ
jgi:cysteine desulfurase